MSPAYKTANHTLGSRKSKCTPALLLASTGMPAIFAVAMAQEGTIPQGELRATSDMRAEVWRRHLELQIRPSRIP